MSFVKNLGRGFLSNTIDEVKRPAATVNTPGQTPEELALLREQTNILRQQQATLGDQLKQQNLLQPLLFGQLGIEEVRDEKGNVTGYKRSGKQAEIEELQQQRTLDALKGNLPVDPAFERSRQEQRMTLGETMRKNLGDGWQTSTPGMQAQADFDARTEELAHGIRTGTLQSNEAMANARASNTFGGIMSAGQAQLPFMQQGVNLAGAFSGPLNNFLSRAKLGQDAQIAQGGFMTDRYKTAMDFRGRAFSAVFS